MAFLIITMIVYRNSITQGGCPYVLIFWINALPFELKSLFVFTMVGPKQNAGSLLTPDSDTVLVHCHKVPSVLISMVAI